MDNQRQHPSSPFDGEHADLPTTPQTPMNNSTSQQPAQQQAPPQQPQQPGQIIKTKSNGPIKIKRWECSKCKYVYEGTQVLDKCPKCGADNQYFVDVD